jgi:6-phosphofructokinase 1
MAEPAKRIAVVTAGGDCPGLNAAIRAVVRAAQNMHRWEVWGVRDGMEGFVMPRDKGLFRITGDQVAGILDQGGTILGASNTCDIFAVDLGSGPEDLSGRVTETMQALGLEALVAIGGDGTHHQALKLFEKNVPVVGLPKTIDNDLGGTDRTFGFDTAVGIVMEAVDRLHTTAQSHHRALCVEVMGRHAGWIALHGGLAAGADVILLPEIPYDPDMIARRVASRARYGKRSSMIVIAEGAKTPGGDLVYRQGEGRDVRRDRLGGVAFRVADELRERGIQKVRTVVLGHVQRGGTPSAYDRVLATRLGQHAVGMVERGEFGRTAVLQGTEVTSVTMDQAVRAKRVDPKGQLVTCAREIGISFAAADGSDEHYAQLRTQHGFP